MKKVKFRPFLNIILTIGLTLSLLCNANAAAGGTASTSESENIGPASTTENDNIGPASTSESENIGPASTSESENIGTAPTDQENGGAVDTPTSDPGTEIGVVTVKATKSQDDQVAHDANLGVLGAKDFMDTPFNVTGYTAATIEDEQAETLYDVLVNDPSVRFTTSADGPNENYKIRGFDLNFQHLYFNGMQGLAPHHRVPVEFLERVEALKGPSSFLYGGVNTSVGGAINLVPKRAGEENITTFTTDYASASYFGGHFDLGRRFGANKEWGIRCNGVLADGDSQTDGQTKERSLGALAVDYRSDKWRLSLDTYRSEESYDNGAVSNYYLANGYVEAPDGSTNLYQGTSGAIKNTGVLFKGECDIRDNLTAYAGIGTLSVDAIGFINGNHVYLKYDDGTAYLRNLYKQYFWTETTSAELGLRGVYRTGVVNHQVVLGANLQDTDYSNAFTTYIPGSYSILTYLNNPVSFGSEYDGVTQPDRGNKTLVTQLSSLVLSDTLSFAEDKVQLTLGVRRQNVDQTTYKYANNLAAGDPTSTINYKSDAVTPLVGLVFKPRDGLVALYANYIEALSPGTVVGAGFDNANEVLEPYKTKQHEVGVKWDQGNFAHTLALFQIEMPGLMTLNNIYSYDGEQRHRGVEWNIFGSVVQGLRLLGGIAYTHGELVRSNVSANNGNFPFGVPEWTVNTGVEWDAPWHKDLCLSLRAIYTGSQYINNANTIKIPDWVRWDIGARYKTVIRMTPVVFRVNIENLFDEHYWAGCFNETYVTLGAPRTFKLSATMRF
jgi:iron complex outermembrane receptor protein